MTATRDRRLVAFVAFGAAVILAEYAVTRTAAFRRGAAVPLAVLFDLVVVLPGLFVAAVLLPAKRRLVGAAPVLAMTGLVASVLLSGRPEVKLPLQLVGVVVELAVLLALVRRLRAAASQLQGAPGEDLLLRLGALTDPVLRLAGAELAALYYAFVGPRRRRPLRAHEFGYVERGGLAGLLFGLGLLLGMEGLGAHFLLRAWSPRVAYVHAAGTGYALVWLWAVYQAARLRPVAVTDTHVLVRTSLLWTVEVPRTLIAAVTDIDEVPCGRGVLRAALGAPPNLLMTLTASVEARGPVGVRRLVSRIALHVDEPARLRAALLVGSGQQGRVR